MPTGVSARAIAVSAIIKNMAGTMTTGRADVKSHISVNLTHPSGGCLSPRDGSSPGRVTPLTGVSPWGDMTPTPDITLAAAQRARGWLAHARTRVHEANRALNKGRVTSARETLIEADEALTYAQHAMDRVLERGSEC